VELAESAPAVGRRCGGRECQGAGHAVRRRPASTVGCPPIRFPRPGSGRPTVRCPAVRCPAVRCPVSWFRRPGSNRPVSGHLVSARPPGHLLVCVSPAVPWDHIGAAGNLDGRDGSGCRWSAVSRAAWSTARVRLKGGDAVEVVGRWGSGGRGPGRVGLGHRLRRARPLAGRGRPAWRKGRRSLPANLGCGSAGPSATSCLWAWLAPCLEHDHATWSLWSLMAGWTSLEGPTRSTARMGCGPSAAQPASQRAWLGARRRCELREQWWARQGLNL
jgi:hypothetical protein